jgi:hypothetical protein
MGGGAAGASRTGAGATGAAVVGAPGGESLGAAAPEELTGGTGGVGAGGDDSGGVVDETGGMLVFGAAGDDVGEGATGAGAALCALALVAPKRAARKIAPAVTCRARVPVRAHTGGSVTDIQIADSMFGMFGMRTNVRTSRKSSESLALKH